jgi:peptide/nickel transport system substrate-binding protein
VRLLDPIPHSRTANGRVHRFAPLAFAIVLVGALCSRASATDLAKHKVSPGGTATFALQPTDDFSWMLPLENSDNEEPWELSTDESLWLPLYFPGDGSKPVINYSLSLGNPPVYSDHDQTITITLKHFKWSNGQPVTTRDVEFFFNLYKAGESKIGTYVPGEFPGNIASIDYPNATTFVLHLKRPFGEQWYTDNQLINIVPMPQRAWDVESAGGKVGNYDLTTNGATKVFNFLYGQSEKLSTYASNTLWKVVDGPFTVTSFDSVSGRTELTANPAYDGPDKSRLSHVIIESFPSAAAEVDALRSGEIDYGYIPYSDYGLVGYFKSHGYTVAPWAPDYEESVELGWTSPTYGPFIRQLYIREALQHLINEPLYLKTTLDGIGQLTYGPVPNIPGSPYVSPQERTDPYPFSIKSARSLLTDHGWKMGSSGFMVCARAGTANNECGKGIAKGRLLSLRMDFTITDLVNLSAQAQYFQTSAKQAGIDVDLHPEQATTMYSIDGVCPPGPCNFAMALYPLWFTNYGDLAILPTLEQEFAKGNYYGGGFYSPTAQALIASAEEHSGLSYLFALENWIARDEAALWWTTGDNQISVVSNKLQGWSPQLPFGNILPNAWYFKS